MRKFGHNFTKLTNNVNYLLILSGIVTLPRKDNMMKIILKGIFSTIEESIKHSKNDHAEGNEPWALNCYAGWKEW